MMPSASSSAGNPGPVLFLDSGIGGLPYLEMARRQMPGVDFAYLADTANFPYGEKSPSRVVAAVTAAVGRAIDRLQPRAIVVACNTASVLALRSLRESFAVPFVGTVPAIKPAALRSRNRRVGLLATRRTVHARTLKDMIRSFASDCRVVLVPAGGVVEFVERRYFGSSPSQRAAIAERAVAAMRRRRVDVVVLACTHFLHLEPELRDALGAGIDVIDSREGVVRQLARVLGPQASAASAASASSAARLYVTRAGEAQERYRSYCDKYGLELAGELA